MKAAALLLAIAMLASASAFAQGLEIKDPTLPVILNLVPGAGLGSFVQADILGGLVCAAGEGIGYTLIFESMIIRLAKEDDAPLFWSGFGIWAATKIYCVVRPISFARRENAKRGLASLGIAPSLSSGSGGAPCPGLVLKLSY